MKNKGGELISAQVVLSGAAAQPQAVVNEFVRAGFDVGALFANSFAITAPTERFEKYFDVGLRLSDREGVQVKTKAGKAFGSDLPLEALPPAVKNQVEMILFTKPPDFGLGGSF